MVYSDLVTVASSLFFGDTGESLKDPIQAFTLDKRVEKVFSAFSSRHTSKSIRHAYRFTLFDQKPLAPSTLGPVTIYSSGNNARGAARLSNYRSKFSPFGALTSDEPHRLTLNPKPVDFNRGPSRW